MLISLPRCPLADIAAALSLCLAPMTCLREGGGGRGGIGVRGWGRGDVWGCGIWGVGAGGVWRGGGGWGGGAAGSPGGPPRERAPLPLRPARRSLAATSPPLGRA